MNNLEVILESIINEGNTKRDQILREAQEKADEIIYQSKNEAEIKAREIIDKANREAETILANENISAKRESRDIEISAKNKVIDQIVDKLLENLKNIDESSYKNFVLNTIKKSDIKSGDLLLAKNYRDALKNEDFHGFTVADESVEDGFVIKSGKIEYDNRFSSIIKYNIDDIRKQISSEIFK